MRVAIGWSGVLTALVMTARVSCPCLRSCLEIVSKQSFFDFFRLFEIEVRSATFAGCSRRRMSVRAVPCVQSLQLRLFRGLGTIGDPCLMDIVSVVHWRSPCTQRFNWSRAFDILPTQTKGKIKNHSYEHVHNAEFLCQMKRRSL
jgi:hypothetical protein